MHGIVLYELKRFISSNYGNDVWYKVLDHIGESGVNYTPAQIYDDELAFKLVGSVCEILGITQAQALMAFGEYIAEPLTEVYKSLIKKEWTVIDLIANVEEVIHRVVRLKMKGAVPPELETVKTSEDELLITYTSQRQMCDLLKGIVVGLGKLYGEYLEPEEQQCMQDGGPKCVILARRVDQIPESAMDEIDTEIVKSEVLDKKKRSRFKFWKR